MEKDFRDELLIKGREDRYFHPIKTRNYLLSIQASDVHYCEPRRILDDIRLYKTWEIAIINNNKNEWVNIKYDEVDKEFFSKWKLYDEFVERYDGMVAGYIETETVQSLYDFLKNIDSNKI